MGETASNNSHSSDLDNSKRMKRLTTDFNLMRNKMKLDSQVSQIQFQLLQKEFYQLKEDAAKQNNRIYSLLAKAMPNSSEELLSEFLTAAENDADTAKKNLPSDEDRQQLLDTKCQELEHSLDKLTRHVTETDQQIQSMKEQLNKIQKSKKSNHTTTVHQSAEPQREDDEQLQERVTRNDELIEILREDLSDVKKSVAKYLAKRESKKAALGNLEDGNEGRRADAEDDDDDDSFLITENEEDFEHHFLPGDTYSFFAVADYTKGYFLTSTIAMATTILVVQLVTLAIFIIDVFDYKSSDNPISVPPGVGIQVRMSQVIALLISCWNQDEIRASVNTFSSGYNAGRVYMISSSANRFKWYFSIFVRIFVGCLSLTVTFILIVNSNTVRDVMLDFAAVTFVSELDNGAFLLSAWGYMGRKIQKLTMRIKKIPIYEREKSDPDTKKARKVPRLVSLFFIVSVICGFWSWIAIKQANGKYMDQFLFVQFGDDFSPEIAAFSGLYGIELDNTMDGMRVNYVDLATDTSIFSYCTQDATWLFQYGENPDGGDSDDFFADCWWKARSAETEELDITKASTIPWYVLNGDLKLESPLQHFSVAGQKNYYGQSCRNNRDCGDRMVCEDETKLCTCIDDYFGVNCEFVDPCQTLEIDPRDLNGFSGTRSWSRRFSSIKEDGKESPYQAYGKPIYFGERSVDGLLDVLFFTGRRWILTDSMHIEEYQPSPGVSARRSLADFLVNSFHAYWSNYTFYFTTEPVDVGTPTDSATPVGLQWFRLETSGTSGGVNIKSGAKIWEGKMNIESNLFCAICSNETNPCFYGASCKSDGTCACTTGSSGRLCQIPPDGNGLCDVFFNTPEFGYDGGDCCQETCISTEQYTCGNGMIENAAGMFAYGFVGYPNCQDPRFSSKLSGSTTLYNIVDRGFLQCGSSPSNGFVESEDGVYSGFEVDLCRAIAAAVLGDPDAIEIVETTSSTRFSDLSDGKYDVLLRRTTHTAERDIYQSGAKVGFSFAPIPTLFDGLRYGGIPPFSNCADNVDFKSAECLDLKICVSQSTSWFPVTQRLFPSSMILAVDSQQAEIDGLEAGLCNVIAGEISLVAEFSVREKGFTGPTYDLGENVFSKEPLSAVMRQNDRVWFKFVSWVFEALIQAEEYGVTQLTASNLAPTDLFGERFHNMFQNAVGANGNYGELYEKNLEDKFPRSGLNTINMGNSGLIYAFPFGSIETQGQGPVTGGSMEAIRKRGILNCGVTITPGFAEFDPETRIWSGFEVDMCRGIAAALLGGSASVEFVPLTIPDRFTMLAGGVIDVMGSTTTQTLEREMKESITGEGFDFTPTIFHDGMGFGGSPAFVLCAESLTFDSLTLSTECPSTRICVTDGSTWLAAMQGPLGIPQENIVITAAQEEYYERLITGECNVVAGETSQIAESTARQYGYPAGEDYLVSASRFTKEPLALVSRSDDPQFSDFLRWIVFGFFHAAEQDITSEDFLDMPAGNFLFGDAFTAMWQHAVGAVGNYNEMFTRNFAGISELGGLNHVNNNNGPQFYAKPGVAMNS